MRTATRARVPLLIGAGAIGALIAALAYGHGAEQQAIPGLPTAGPLTGWGLPVLRVIGQLAAATTVGNLVAALFWTPRPGPADHPVGRAHTRLARWSALVWTVTSAASWLLTISAARGLPVAEILTPDVLVNVGLHTPTGRAGVVVLLSAAVTVLCCAGRPGPERIAAALASGLLGLLPPAFVGHPVAMTYRSAAVACLLVHILAASLWVGGVIAVLIRAKVDRASLPRAAVRYRRLAVPCLVATAITGGLNGYFRLTGTADGLSSPYGTLILAKLGGLLLLGGVGWWYAARAVAGLRADRPGLFVRFAVAEAVVLAGVVGLAGALARTPVPLEVTSPDQTASAEMLGYDLPASVTGWRLVFDWRPDLFFVVLVAAAVAGYLRVELRAHRAGIPWPMRRTLAWLGGAAVVVAATSGGVGRYASAFLSIALLQHVLLGVVAPLLLVRGAPVTLALRVLPRAAEPDWTGPGDWLRSTLRSGPLRVLTQPAVAVPLWGAGVFGPYVTGLFEASLWSPALHLILTTYALVTGYLMSWAIAGADPSPAGRRRPAVQAVTAVAALATTLAAGLTIASGQWLVAGEWYVGLQRVLVLRWPFGSLTLLADQAMAGTLFWVLAGGVLVFVAAHRLIVGDAIRRVAPATTTDDQPSDEEEAVAVGEQRGRPADTFLDARTGR